LRDDKNNIGEQWDNFKGSQGKWEHRKDNTAGMGGDTYTSQNLGQSGYEYGSNRDTVGGGGQTGTGPGDLYGSSGEYGGPDTTGGQTAGYVDPRIAGGVRQQPDVDDEYATVDAGGGPTGKPSMTSRVMGAAEKIAGKITGDPDKQARGREREEGTF